MPKAKIEFLQASWLDIDRISDFYLREVGPVSAEKAIDEIMEHIGILGEHPYAGPLHPDPVLAKQEYRKLVLTKTYIAVYRVIGDTVYIYRVEKKKTDYQEFSQGIIQSESDFLMRLHEQEANYHGE